MGTKFYFTIEEEGSFHESRYYNTRQEAENAGRRYLKSNQGRYAYPNTLKIKSVTEKGSNSIHIKTPRYF